MVRRKWIILSALVASLLLAGVVLANGVPSIDWWVIAGGGGSTTVGSTSLAGVIGQWVVGSGTAGPQWHRVYDLFDAYKARLRLQ